MRLITTSPKKTSTRISTTTGTMEEMARIRCSGLRWIRSRYSIDDQVSVDDYNPNYTVDIPVEILPE